MDVIRIEYSRRTHRSAIGELEASSFTIRPEMLVPVTHSRLSDMGVRLVALKHDRVVGYLAGTWRFDSPPVRRVRRLWIVALAVDAQYRRQGIGRRLLTAAFERAGARGARSFHLSVQVENTGAIALYESLGFEVRERQLGSYGVLRDGFWMIRTSADTDRGSASGG
jgi:ribosomal protein S18 acetylase RimI-like enzyme